MVRLGAGPQGAKLEARHAVPIKKLSLGEVLELYLDAAARRQKESSRKETERHLMTAHRRQYPCRWRVPTDGLIEAEATRYYARQNGLPHSIMTSCRVKPISRR